ncbi:MAG: hypothetical protein ACTSYI_16985 [Promethearchaeota archaeon]
MQLKQLREPKPNKISFRTIYYSKKHLDPSQSAQVGESMLENALITLLEHDPDVLEYLNQAVPKDNSGDFKPLTYRRSDGVIEEWTPDFTDDRLLTFLKKGLGKIQGFKGFPIPLKMLNHAKDELKRTQYDTSEGLLLMDSIGQKIQEKKKLAHKDLKFLETVCFELRSNLLFFIRKALPFTMLSIAETLNFSRE